MAAGILEFSQLDRSDYDLFSRNCATAVVGFMKAIGCIPQEEKFYPPVRPQTIAKRASEIALNTIQAERESIRALKADTPKDKFKKIEKLIENDIQRLQEQIKYDEIAHLFYKSKSTKQDKVNELKKIASRCMAAQFVNSPEEYNNLHLSLLAVRALGSKTAKNINECLHFFPTESLSPDYRASQHHALEADVDYYKTARTFILVDDELSELETLRALVDNDIQRLHAQIEKDKTTTLGRHKDPEKKQYKIRELESLSRLLKTEPTDYKACLTCLQKLMADEKMQGKTVEKYLQQCMDRFPYDRLPQIEGIRDYLVRLDVLLKPYEEKQDQRFFSVLKSPGGVKTLRGLVTHSENTIKGLSAKEVYERFYKIDAELQGNINKKRDPLMLYEDARLLAEPLMMAITSPTTPRAKEGKDDIEVRASVMKAQRRGSP
jgi:hypothetical protein